MMPYTIGEVAKKFNLTHSTIRYYDQEGLIPNITKDERGNRIFDEEALAGLMTIECLKKSGMPIKDIKKFIDWCQQGDDSLQDRLAMFVAQKEALQAHIQELEHTLTYIDYKVAYYTKALADGTEENVKAHMTNPVLHQIR